MTYCFARLGVRVNALFFTGFGISAVMGVVFNNTIVPKLGWDWMFIILGCFSLVSFIMLLFFAPTRDVFIPYDANEERAYFGIQDDEKPKERKQKRRRREGSHDQS